MNEKITDINKYLEKIGQYPLLSEEEQNNLQLEVKENNSAREQLYQSNLRLVIQVIKKYLDGNIDAIKLIECGNDGLIRAIDSYKSTDDMKPSSWYVWHIDQAINEYLKKQS